MAVKLILICDGCGKPICHEYGNVRRLRAFAQLQCGAVSTGGKDYCASCRKARAAVPAGDALKGAPSVGTQR